MCITSSRPSCSRKRQCVRCEAVSSQAHAPPRWPKQDVLRRSTNSPWLGPHTSALGHCARRRFFLHPAGIAVGHLFRNEVGRQASHLGPLRSREELGSQRTPPPEEAGFRTVGPLRRRAINQRWMTRYLAICGPRSHRPDGIPLLSQCKVRRQKMDMLGTQIKENSAALRIIKEIDG